MSYTVWAFRFTLSPPYRTWRSHCLFFFLWQCNCFKIMHALMAWHILFINQHWSYSGCILLELLYSLETWSFYRLTFPIHSFSLTTLPWKNYPLSILWTPAVGTHSTGKKKRLSTSKMTRIWWLNLLTWWFWWDHSSGVDLLLCMPSFVGTANTDPVKKLCSRLLNIFDLN